MNRINKYKRPNRWKNKKIKKNSYNRKSKNPNKINLI